MGRIEGGYRGPDIVSNGLVLNLDAGNPNSYQTYFGNTWKDISGNASNGTLTGGPPTFNSGNGGSFVFNGSNDYVACPSGFANFTGGVTMEAWVYPTSTDFYSRIFDFSNGANNNNVLLSRFGTSLNASFWIFNNGGNSHIASTGDAYSNNSWQHWVATANGTNFKLYKNGVENNSSVNSNLPENVTRANNWIGRSAWNEDAYYKGNIAMARVYNRALSAAEILQNYNATKSRFGLT